MRFSLTQISDRVLTVVAVASGVVLLLSCFALVRMQYDVRTLTAEKSGPSVCITP